MGRASLKDDVPNASVTHPTQPPLALLVATSQSTLALKGYPEDVETSSWVSIMPLLMINKERGNFSHNYAH
jgi:hypothetical protein